MPDDLKLLPQHKPYLGTAYFINPHNLTQGDVITFRYSGDYSPIPKLRWVFVLDPDWEDKLHGLTLGLTPRNVITGPVVQALFESTDAQNVYLPAIQQIAKQYDSYRTYFVNKMQLVRRMPYYLTDKPKLKK